MTNRKPKKGDWVTIQTDLFADKGIIWGRHYKVFKKWWSKASGKYFYYVGSKKFGGRKGFPLYENEISLKK